MANVGEFKEHVLTSGALDPVGVHHEFASGAHGRKLDFDTVQSSDELYRQWVDVNQDALRSYGGSIIGVMGIANGTNRLAADVAERLDVRSLQTHKTIDNKVAVNPDSVEWLMSQGSENEGLVIALEDVGTTGNTALHAIRHAIRSRNTPDNVASVGCLVTFQRSESLRAFDDAGISYKSIIQQVLDTYTPEQCQIEGYCAKGWQFIPHP